MNTLIIAASHEELDASIRAPPLRLLLQLGAQAVNALGARQYLMVKQERINGSLQGEQTIFAPATGL